MTQYGAKEKLATHLEVGDEVFATIDSQEDVGTPWAGPKEVVHVQRVEDEHGNREVRLRFRQGSTVMAPGTRVLVLTQTEEETP